VIDSDIPLVPVLVLVVVAAEEEDFDTPFVQVSVVMGVVLEE